MATHRVVEVIPDPEEAGIYRYRTKGDANEAADAGLVHCKNVLGTPVASHPVFGLCHHLDPESPGNVLRHCIGTLYGAADAAAGIAPAENQEFFGRENGVRGIKTNLF